MPNRPAEPSSESGECTESSLAYLLRSRDPEAGARLDRDYRAALIRFCRGYLGTLDRAEDAAQEVCLKVLGAAHVPDHVRPWIYRIARNHCLALLRRRAVRKEHAAMPPASQLGGVLTGQLTRLARQEMHERVAMLMEQLSLEQREALRLRYVENLSRTEIAEVLEVSEGVVKSRLFEGLKRLRTLARQLDSSS